MTKAVLVEQLHDDIVLEKKLLGERAHKAIREIENQVAGLKKRKKTAMADKFLMRIDQMWEPLREVQAERKAAAAAKKDSQAHEASYKIMKNFDSWRHRVMHKREDLNPVLTPRGNSLKIDFIGATPRGPEVSTPRGYVWQGSYISF